MVGFRKLTPFFARNIIGFAMECRACLVITMVCVPKNEGMAWILFPLRGDDVIHGGMHMDVTVELG